MLKTYRIIPLVFILFLFGFTLITVSPVFAQGQWDPSMGMCHNSRPCMKSNMCGKQCAPNVRESKGWVNPKISELEAESIRVQAASSPSPSGGDVHQMIAKISELPRRLNETWHRVVRMSQEVRLSVNRSMDHVISITLYVWLVLRNWSSPPGHHILITNSGALVASGTKWCRSLCADGVGITEGTPERKHSQGTPAVSGSCKSYGYTYVRLCADKGIPLADQFQ